MQITNLRYDARNRAFLATVLVPGPDGTRRVPARVDGDLTMDPARVSAALATRAARNACPTLC